MENMKMVPTIGYERLRMGSDGAGITTLFCFWGCPLKCKYCLNPQSWKIKKGVKEVSPEQLYQWVSVDRLYFLATGGGVTLGGGEPLLYPNFIAKFCSLVNGEWNVNIETSLNVPQENLKKVIDFVSHYYIDIKEMNDIIYERYTGKSNSQVLSNLKWLVSVVGVDKITVRVPLIPEFNSEEDVAKSIEVLKTEFGIKNIDQFNYQIVNKI